MDNLRAIISAFEQGRNDDDAVKKAIDTLDNIDEQDLNGCSVLHHAAFHQGRKIVEYLVVEKKANKDIKNKEHATPLLYALMNARPEAVDILINNGADINISDDLNQTALHFSAFYGYEQTIKILIEKGAEINIQAENTKATPLHYALKNYYIEASCFLTSKGANIDIPDIEGITARQLLGICNTEPTTQNLLYNSVEKKSDSFVDNIIKQEPTFTPMSHHESFTHNLKKQRESKSPFIPIGM